MRQVLPLVLFCAKLVLSDRDVHVSKSVRVLLQTDGSSNVPSTDPSWACYLLELLRPTYQEDRRLSSAHYSTALDVVLSGFTALESPSEQQRVESARRQERDAFFDARFAPVRDLIGLLLLPLPHDAYRAALGSLFDALTAKPVPPRADGGLLLAHVECARKGTRSLKQLARLSIWEQLRANDSVTDFQVAIFTDLPLPPMLKCFTAQVYTY